MRPGDLVATREFKKLRRDGQKGFVTYEPPREIEGARMVFIYLGTETTEDQFTVSLALDMLGLMFKPNQGENQNG